MVFGYARVSTQEQNLESQLNELHLLGAEIIYSDKGSGKNTKRVELTKLIDNLRTGDTLIITKIDRLSRSLSDLILLLERFSEKQIKLKLGALNFDFTTAEGKLYANLFGAFAQFERELIRERTLKGLENARANGRIGGKPKGLNKEAIVQAKKAYELREKGLTVSDIMKATDIKSTRTFYNYIRYHIQSIAETPDMVSEDGLIYLGKSKYNPK